MASLTGKNLDPESRRLHRVLLTLVGVAMLGFVLANAVTGFDFASKAFITHVHAIAMSVWLVLLVTQSHLGSHGDTALHKRLGWTTCGLAVLMVFTGVLTVRQTLSANSLPPIFTSGYFLMLGLMNLVLFSAFFVAGIQKRRDTAWHRRLMLCTLLVIYEPVLGRLLPFFVIPVLGDPANAIELMVDNRQLIEWLRVIVHSGIVVAVMILDRATTGRFHLAFVFALLAVVSFYAVVNVVGMLPVVQDFADSMAV